MSSGPWSLSRPRQKDRYGRTVAEVFRNGRAVYLAMVQGGQAFAYGKYLAACDGGAYLAAGAQAQRSRRGVWAVPGDRTPSGIGAMDTERPRRLRQGHTDLDRNGDGVACESPG